jgi:hypothetical protein
MMGAEGEEGVDQLNARLLQEDGMMHLGSRAVVEVNETHFIFRRHIQAFLG